MHQGWTFVANSWRPGIVAPLVRVRRSVVVESLDRTSIGRGELVATDDRLASVGYHLVIAAERGSNNPHGRP